MDPKKRVTAADCRITNKGEYKAPIAKSNVIMLTLATIKQRSTGKWEWTLLPSPYHPNWQPYATQGIEPTYEEAEAVVLSAWVD